MINKLIATLIVFFFCLSLVSIPMILLELIGIGHNIKEIVKDIKDNHRI